MRISVRKIKNNIDWSTLTTKYENSNPIENSNVSENQNQNSKSVENPKIDSVVELPELENVIPENNFEELPETFEEPPETFKEPRKYEIIEEKPQPGFFGTIDNKKKFNFSLSAPKNNNYGYAIYAGLGLTLLAQFIG